MMETLQAIPSVELTDGQFEEISGFVRGVCGINLHIGKRELVKARLGKRLRQLGMRSYEEYFEHLHLDRSGDEILSMLDALSTNVTRFFRGSDHFAFLRETLAAREAKAKRRGPLRIWSAGCSSGEEPYSIAITVAEAIPDARSRDVRILASDVSTHMIERARAGVYGATSLQSVPPIVRAKYFTCIEARPRRQYRINAGAADLVHFARLNLMGDWPMRGPFHFIFCRNVMIYFERKAQQELIGRFWGLLARGGLLFVGHSESLAGVKHGFRYIRPTVYVRDR